jgi:hypothetical protein
MLLAFEVANACPHRRLLHQGIDPAPRWSHPRFSVAAVRPLGPRVPLVRLVGDPQMI